MDAVLCLRETAHFQSMELEQPEAICGLESGTRSRLWSTRGDCDRRQEVAFFGLRLAGTEIACLDQFSSVFPRLQICRHRRDHESNVCVVFTADVSRSLLSPDLGIRAKSPQDHRRSLRKEC